MLTPPLTVRTGHSLPPVPPVPAARLLDFLTSSSEFGIQSVSIWGKNPTVVPRRLGARDLSASTNTEEKAQGELRAPQVAAGTNSYCSTTHSTGFAQFTSFSYSELECQAHFSQQLKNLS